MPDSSRFLRSGRLVPAAAGLALAAVCAVPAPGSEAAPAPPAKPYSVFLSYPGEVDAALDARLRNAAGALETALAEHPEWFRLTDSRDEADIRVTLFDAEAATGELRHVGGPAGFVANRVFESRGRDFFAFDAVVRADRKRKQVNGSGTGATELGSIKDAAADFVRKLREFAEESYPVPR